MVLFFVYELLDICGYILGICGRSISFDDLSLSIDEKLGKVPLDRITEYASLLTLEVGIERMSLISIHRYLRKEWKCHTKMHLAYLLDGIVGLRLLSSKLITRESEDHKVIMRISIPEFFE